MVIKSAPMISNFILIIGAMKSGTTTLYDYLMQHPQIAIGPVKEPGFFAFEEKWALGLDWYESQFDFNPNWHRYALDGSTDYTKHPFCREVVDRLKASAPRRFRLIYIMRHPLRRIESHAHHVELTKCEIGQCPSPRSTHSLDAGISPVSIAISRYANQIDLYAEYFDNGELLLLTLEQLAREPNVVLRKVCKFLEIDPLIPGNSSFRSNSAESHALSDPIRPNVYPIWQALHTSSPFRRLVKLVVPEFVRANVYRTATMWARPQGRFRLHENEANNVLAALNQDLLRLRDRYGIDAQKEWGISL
jgi:Sulfotransferase domain